MWWFLLSILVIFMKSCESAILEELYRHQLEPDKGGKVPESAHMRIELNKIDAAGLDDPAAVLMAEHIADEGMVLPERTGPVHVAGSFPRPYPDYADFPFNPVFDSVKLNPKEPFTSYKPKETLASSSIYQPTNPYEVVYNSLFEEFGPPSVPYDEPKSDYDTYNPEPSYAPEPYHPPTPPYHAPEPAYHPEPPYHAPEPSYHAPTPAYHAPEPYTPHKPAYTPEPAYSPEPAYHAAEPAYGPPKPVYHKPVGPILLKERPYEVKSVEPLPITVSETFTSFDCRSVPYPGRHYADPEAHCEIYHFCHEDGKQDTFHCGYGTIFNEYLGTCDYKNNVKCGLGGDGYVPKPHHKPAPYHEPATYHEPAPYHKPAPYHPPTTYRKPAPYHKPAPYRKIAPHHEPTQYPSSSHSDPFSHNAPFVNFGLKN